MLPLTIITVEDHPQLLKQSAVQVSFPLTCKEKQLIAQMKETLFALGGVGLAAPQVGVNKQIIALYIPEEAALLRDQVIVYPMHIMINPSYVPIGVTKITDYEACYSVQSKAGKVARYQHIQLTYTDELGLSHQLQASDFYARVLQHEIDHVHGLLITDRLDAHSIQGSVGEMMARRRAELAPEKQQLFDELMLKKKIRK